MPNNPHNSITGGITNTLRRRYLNELGFGSGRSFTEALRGSLQPGHSFLDVGCGEGALRNVVPAGVKYVGLDRYAGPQSNEYRSWVMRPDVIGDAHCLAFPDATFDGVALMHVLEHVERPQVVLSEICRVLKPNGLLFLDVPFLHEIHHAPHDHYRYTKHGLESLANETGLEVVEMKPSGGYFRTLSHILLEASEGASANGIYAAVVRSLVCLPLRALGAVLQKGQYILDICDVKQEFTVGYHCIFRKPA